MPQTPDPPWYTHITLDLLIHILTNSLFHPYITLLIPLCLRAVATPYTSPEFLAACAWAAFILICKILGAVNKRVAYGVPREVEWDEEVVVITGGASGLGRNLAETFGMRGASVAVLDVREPEEWSEGLAGVRFYACDVGDAGAVERARGRIEEDLGTPTILINNAGIVHGKPLLSLTPLELHRSLTVNLHSHFHTLRTFLPAMLASERGGTIVTVASVLGKLGASHLADYTAAKAGLIAMHASLRAELASTGNIRTILVTPGQLGTKLFGGLQTPNSFFGPVVEPVELAREIVRMIDAGESGEISMPLYARWIEWLHVLPVGMQRIVRRLSGIDTAMQGFAAQGSTATEMKKSK